MRGRNMPKRKARGDWDYLWAVQINRAVTFRVPEFFKTIEKMDKAFAFLGSYDVDAHYSVWPA